MSTTSKHSWVSQRATVYKCHWHPIEKKIFFTPAFAEEVSDLDLECDEADESDSLMECPMVDSHLVHFANGLAEKMDELKCNDAYEDADDLCSDSKNEDLTEKV